MDGHGSDDHHRTASKPARAGLQTGGADPSSCTARLAWKPPRQPQQATRTGHDMQATPGAAAPAEAFRGVWQAMYSACGGIAIAIVCYAAYNYLVSRVNAIVLDMEKASGEAARLVLSDTPNGTNGR